MDNDGVILERYKYKNKIIFKWVAQIELNNKIIKLGEYDNSVEAFYKYKNMALKYPEKKRCLIK